jgi:hypothetical protein
MSVVKSVKSVTQHRSYKNAQVVILVYVVQMENPLKRQHVVLVSMVLKEVAV